MLDYSSFNYTLTGNAIWMAWNLFLALIPFFLASHLFAPKRRINASWKLLFPLFVLFLPNAPYIFTDLIHLYYAKQDIVSVPVLLLTVIEFMFFLLIGFYLFAESYHRFEKFLPKKLYVKRYFIRLVAFVTTSVGVYLGRFDRLNSWDALFQPKLVLYKLIENLQNVQMYIFVTGFSLLLMLLFIVYEYKKEYR